MSFKKMQKIAQLELLNDLCVDYLCKLKTTDMDGFRSLTRIENIPMFVNLSPHQQYERIVTFMTRTFFPRTPALKKNLIYYSLYLALFFILEDSIINEVENKKQEVAEKEREKKSGPKEFLFTNEDINKPDPSVLYAKNQIVYRKFGLEFESIKNKCVVKQARKKEIMKIAKRRFRGEKLNGNNLMNELAKYLEKQKKKKSQEEKTITQSSRKSLLQSLRKRYPSTSYDSKKNDFDISPTQERKKVYETLKELFPNETIHPSLPFCEDLDLWKRIIQDLLLPNYFTISDDLKEFLVGDLDANDLERAVLMMKFVKWMDAQYCSTFNFPSLYIAEMTSNIFSGVIPTEEHCKEVLRGEDTMATNTKNRRKIHFMWLSIHQEIKRNCHGYLTDENAYYALLKAWKKGLGKDIIPMPFVKRDLLQRSSGTPNGETWHNQFANEGVQYFSYRPEEVRKLRFFFVCAYCGRREERNSEFKKCTGCKVARYCSVECQRKHWKKGKVGSGEEKEGHRGKCRVFRKHWDENRVRSREDFCPKSLVSLDAISKYHYWHRNFRM